MPNLLALDAEVELASRRGARRVPVGEFVTGNRRTARAPDELVTGLFVPAAIAGTTVRSAFEKLGSRAYLVISIAMVAAVAEVGAGRPDRASAGRGRRLLRGGADACRQLEAELAGRARDAATSADALVRAEHLAGLAPIDDVRGTAAYRREAALVLVRRALDRGRWRDDRCRPAPADRASSFVVNGRAVVGRASTRCGGCRTSSATTSG